MILPIISEPTKDGVFPIITIALMAVNLFVFVCLQDRGNEAKFTILYSMHPREAINGYVLEVEPNGDIKEITGNQTLDQMRFAFIQPVIGHIPPEQNVNDRSPLSQLCGSLENRLIRDGHSPAPLSTFFTYMFLHRDWMHILFNMLFLFVFGSGLEAFMGRFRFLSFYIAAGFFAGFLSALTTWAYYGLGVDVAPAIMSHLGASGAIAGVMGGFVSLMPKTKIRLLPLWNPFIAFFVNLKVPAWLYLIPWFAWESYLLISGIRQHQIGGTDHAGHVGGFVAGVFLGSADAFALSIILLYIFPALWPLLRALLGKRWG